MAEILSAFTNGTETYLARDMDHLRELYRKNTGLDLEDDDAIGDGWEDLGPDVRLQAWTGEEPGDGELLNLTIPEWLARTDLQVGPGFFGSKEF